MEELQRQKPFTLNAAQLKWIAVVLMTLDHMGAFILEPLLKSGYLAGTWRMLDTLLRALGRPAFPIFCFLISEGFRHTHDRRAYCLRLGVFALIAEPFFDFGITGKWFDLEYQSVFITLLLGLLTLWCLERFRGRIVVQLACVAVFCVINQLLNADYGLLGIAMIAAIGCWRDENPELFFVRLLAVMLFGSLAKYCLMGYVNMGIAFLDRFSVMLDLALNQCIGVLAVPLFWRYNGKKGRAGNKYFFYIYYPAHIFLLGLVRVMLIHFVFV